MKAKISKSIEIFIKCQTDIKALVSKVSKGCQ